MEPCSPVEPCRPAEPARTGELVVAARAGDRAAFAELFRLHERDVTAVARRGNELRPHEVADVVQETFARALAQLGQLRAPELFAPWVKTIARHVVADQWRLRARFTTASDEDDEPASTAPQPAEAAEARDLLARLGEAARTLSSRDATILALVAQLGLSTAELGEVLGVSANAAKVALHRARRRLRDAVGAPVG